MKYLRVLDSRGNRIPASALSGNYEAAGMGRRLSTWGTSGSGPNTALYSSLGTLRSRSRELVRNNPLAESAVESLVSNLIGTGITPRWLLDNVRLKKNIQELWTDWTKESDSDGVQDFCGQQAMVARAMAESGEVLARFRPRPPDDDLSVPLQIQILESDHLDESYNTTVPGGNEVRMGIEFDRENRRAAYWLFKNHPGESFPLGSTVERIRIPAREILHVYRPLRPGQARGRPWLTSVIVRLHELDQYEDAELVRKKTAAMFGGFITESPGEDEAVSPLGKRAENDSEGRDVIALEPGTFPVLPPGMSVVFSEPSDVGGSYEIWIKQNLREVASGIGVTYEQLTGDLTGVNYSSIRAGLLEFRRRCQMLQAQTIVFQFCQPVARRWVQTAIASGALSVPGGYASANLRRYYRIEWHPQGWPWVDPLKDVMAQQLSVRSGFTSRAAVVNELGYDIEVVDQQLKEDADRADSLGLVLDSDPRQTEKSGALQTAEDAAAKEVSTNAE